MQDRFLVFIFARRYSLKTTKLVIVFGTIFFGKFAAKTWSMNCKKYNPVTLSSQHFFGSFYDKREELGPET